jgi:hypothetical protein
LAIFIAFGILVFAVIVATASGTLNGRELLDDLLDFMKWWWALKGS